MVATKGAATAAAPQATGTPAHHPDPGRGSRKEPAAG
jgi:hypothetical protein